MKNISSEIFKKFLYWFLVNNLNDDIKVLDLLIEIDELVLQKIK